MKHLCFGWCLMANLGILIWLEQGYQVQSYKMGPDYIDLTSPVGLAALLNVGRDTSVIRVLGPTTNVEMQMWRQSRRGHGAHDGLGTDKDCASSASVATLGIRLS